jgi:hypothetical protein
MFIVRRILLIAIIITHGQNPKIPNYQNNALFWENMSTFLQEFVCDLELQDRTFSHVCILTVGLPPANYLV